MESRREGSTQFRRIQWTRALEDSLLVAASVSEPAKRGYHERLQSEWLARHLDLPSRGSALAQHARVVYARGDSGREPVGGVDVGDRRGGDVDVDVDVDVDIDREELEQGDNSQPEAVYAKTTGSVYYSS